MAEEKVENKKNTTKSSSSFNSFNFGVPLSDIFFMTLRHWQWIIVSVVLCVGVAYVYLLSKPNVYYRAADLMIKDESTGRSSIGDEFVDISLIKKNTNLQNEISNLCSKGMMEEVVRRLGLDYNYYYKGNFYDRDAYGSNLPIKVSIAGHSEEDSFSFHLALSGNGDVTLSDLKLGGGRESEGNIKGKLNKAFSTPMGMMLVSTTPAYKKGESVELIVKKIPLTAATGSYNGRLGVTVTNEMGSVLRLTMADRSTERADDVLNTLIAVYNENWIRDRNQIAVSTSNFINERLNVIEGELGNVDSDISSYKSNNLIPDVDAAASMYMSKSQENQSAILDINNQLSIARYVRQYLASENNPNQLLPANVGLQNQSVQNLINDYNSKVFQRKSLVDKSSESNPLVTQLDDQLMAQRQAILRTIDNEIVALSTQLASLQGSEAHTMSKIASNPTQAMNLLSVERQQKVKEALYLFLLQKREENELSQAFTAYNTHVVNKPGGAGAPTPDRRKILSYAFLIGLVIPFGVTYLKEMNNTKVRGRKDVEHLAVPFLGEIPQYAPPVKKGEPKPEIKTLVVQEGRRNQINEAFRVLRTNVEFMCDSIDGTKYIAITSFNPGSGKSFISVNLGVSIALKGKRVLVIDGDLRHGSSSSYVGSPEVGLSNYLSGHDITLKDIIKQDTDCENFYILPIGKIPPNPTELLESARFADMLEDLKGNFDYVLVDCPPIEVVADAQIIDRYVNRTFFIVRAGLLDRSMVDELDRLYEDKKFKNMAFILNGTYNEHTRYGYKHAYRYGYGYGYGYGYNYGSADKKDV